MAKNRYLKRKAFRQYLLDHAEETVGVIRTNRTCPVAVYLEDQTKRYWQVSPLACVPQVDAEPGEDADHLNHEFRPPLWARNFMHALDKHFGRTPRSISGEEALYILEEYA